MDRKEQVKYSLRDVFGLEGAVSKRTQELMESYELAPVQIEHTGLTKPSAAEIIREAIETGVIPQFDDHDTSPSAGRAQRDDLALLRWRKMAGLDVESGS